MGVGLSDGTAYKDEEEWMASTMAPQAPRKPTGALESESGTTLPLEDKTNVRPSNGILGPIQNLPNIEDVPHHDWVENLFKSIGQAVVLPGKVKSGEIDPMSQQGIEQTFDLANLMVFGPAPVAAKMADGTLGSFAGVRSANIRSKVKEFGEALLSDAEGVHPNDIWDNTGFFKGVDNKWRYEIPDEGAKLGKGLGEGIFPATEGSTGILDDQANKAAHTIFFKSKKDELLPITDVLEHPELYKEYPQLKDIKIARLPDKDIAEGTRGMMDTKKGVLSLSDKLSPEKAKGVILHELQHAIQDIEGFSKGSNPLEFNDLPDIAFEKYRRAGGEVEARNVQTRMNMDWLQRKIKSPVTTEDVPRFLQTNSRGFGMSKDMTKPETIKAPALKYKGEVVEAENHGMALNKILDKYANEELGHPELEYQKVKDGFTTTHGRFISREEAFQLAAKRDQVDPKVMRAYKPDDNGKFITQEGDEPMLLSEDLQ